MQESEINNLNRYKETKRVTIVGAGINIVLAFVQLIGGFFSQSQGLIADGLHTLSDLLSDGVVLIASKEAHRKADAEHPYGHGRIETLATSILGAILLSVGVGIAIDTGERLISGERLLEPSALALVFAFLAVLAKEGLYQYTMRVAKKVNSSLLKANAWHHRSDAISSVFVILGIAFSLLGFKYFDAIAALLVAAMIGRMGWQFLWQSSQELIDASLDEEIVEELRKLIMDVDGVVSLHQLRTRQSGSDAFADVHIQVPSYISVSEGHQIAEAVRRTVVDNIESVTDVTVHTDPEDDDIAAPCKHLPLRNDLLTTLQKSWGEIDLAKKMEQVRVHYLDGKVELEIYFSQQLPLDWHEEKEKLEAIILQNPDVRKVSFFTEH